MKRSSNGSGANEQFIESSGNIFEDMALDNSDELLARSQLGHSIRMILKEKGWKQGEFRNFEDMLIEDLISSDHAIAYLKAAF